MKKMTGEQYTMVVLLGGNVPSEGLTIEGNVVLEGVSDRSRLYLEGLDLGGVRLLGNVHIRNVVFNGDVNLNFTHVAGRIFLFENVTVIGNFTQFEGLRKMVKDGWHVTVSNISFTGVQPFGL